MPDSVLQARSAKYRRKQWEEWFSSEPTDEILYVLTSDDTVVGFAISKPNRDSDICAKGEMHAGYILPEFRGGISGPIMMKALANKMIELDQWPACIWAFQNNPHRRFYSALGWHAVVRRNRIIAGEEIPEVGYESPDFIELNDRLDRMIELAVQRQIRPPSVPTSRPAHQAS